MWPNSGAISSVIMISYTQWSSTRLFIMWYSLTHYRVCCWFSKGYSKCEFFGLSLFPVKVYIPVIRQRLSQTIIPQIIRRLRWNVCSVQWVKINVSLRAQWWIRSTFPWGFKYLLGKIKEENVSLRMSKSLCPISVVQDAFVKTWFVNYAVGQRLTELTR